MCAYDWRLASSAAWAACSAIVVSACPSASRAALAISCPTDEIGDAPLPIVIKEKGRRRRPELVYLERIPVMLHSRHERRS